MLQGGVPMWLSRLKIQPYHCSGSGCCCGVGSIPDPGISICCGCGKKKKKKATRIYYTTDGIQPMFYNYK